MKKERFIIEKDAAISSDAEFIVNKGYELYTIFPEHFAENESKDGFVIKEHFYIKRYKDFNEILNEIHESERRGKKRIKKYLYGVTIEGKDRREMSDEPCTIFDNIVKARSKDDILKNLDKTCDFTSMGEITVYIKELQPFEI